MESIVKIVFEINRFLLPMCDALNEVELTPAKREGLLRNNVLWNYVIYCSCQSESNAIEVEDEKKMLCHILHNDRETLMSVQNHLHMKEKDSRLGFAERRRALLLQLELDHLLRLYGLLVEEIEVKLALEQLNCTPQVVRKGEIELMEVSNNFDDKPQPVFEKKSEQESDLCNYGFYNRSQQFHAEDPDLKQDSNYVNDGNLTAFSLKKWHTWMQGFTVDEEKSDNKTKKSTKGDRTIKRLQDQDRPIDLTIARKKYKKYSPEDLEKALDEFKNGTPIAELHVRYNIPTRTLYMKAKELRQHPMES